MKAYAKEFGPQYDDDRTKIEVSFFITAADIRKLLEEGIDLETFFKAPITDARQWAHDVADVADALADPEWAKTYVEAECGTLTGILTSMVDADQVITLGRGTGTKPTSEPFVAALHTSTSWYDDARDAARYDTITPWEFEKVVEGGSHEFPQPPALPSPEDEK